MKKLLNSVGRFARTHKLISIIIAMVIIGGGYWWYSKASSTKSATLYTMGTVASGTIVQTVSGSGQVSAANQIDFSAKASGNLILKVAQGEHVKAGQVIAQISDQSALNSLRSSEISYEKLIQPAATATLISSQSAVTNAKTSLDKSYVDAYNSIVSAYTDMSTVLTGLNDIYYSSDKSPYFSDQKLAAQDYGTVATRYKYTAGSELDQALSAFKSAQVQFILATKNNTIPDNDSLNTMLDATYVLANQVYKTVQDAAVAINYVVNAVDQSNRTNVMTTDQSNVSSWVSKIQSDASGLLASKNTIVSSKNSLAQAEANLESVQTGTESLDLEAGRISLAQQRTNYYDNYFITAPFDGVVASISAKNGDPITSGTKIATLITTNQVTDISLNEIDVAKVKVGDKATLTFDALPDLTLTGTVGTVGLIGNVTQGVVSYTVQVVFDTTDSQVLSGMSVSAAIITDSKQGVLVVPSSAVKTANDGSSYVLVFPNQTAANNQITTTATPSQKTVEVGVSNDTEAEITSGLNEGDTIVVRSVATTVSAKTAASGFSLLGGGTRSGSGAGAVRAIAR